MTLAGPDALRALEEALRDVRREEDEIARRLARDAEIVARLRASEGELLRQLAALRLDAATQRELSGRLLQAEVKARELLAQHAGNLNETERQLKDFDARLGVLYAERAGLAGEVEQARAELGGLGDSVARGTVRNADYKRRLAEAEGLEAVAAESLRKTQQAEADREHKGRPYRDDPLFMYLWERGFGTRNYRENGLISWLDGLVAGLVRFAGARVNFAMLNEIPLRLREHADRQQQSAEAARLEVSAIETAALDAAGGRPLRDALSAAQGRIAAIEEESLKLEDRRDESARQLRELAQGNDPAFASATATLTEALGREDIRVMLSEARAAASGEDAAIVVQIDEARRRAVADERDTGEQKARLKTLGTRRRELEDIQYEFRKADFGSPASQFADDGLAGAMLTEFLRGEVGAADYWARWRRSQSWVGTSRPERAAPDEGARRGSGRPRGTASGFSRPRSRGGARAASV